MSRAQLAFQSSCGIESARHHPMAYEDKQTNKEAAMKMQQAHEDGAFFRAH
jgi:hypothetical protein